MNLHTFIATAAAFLGIAVNASAQYKTLTDIGYTAKTDKYAQERCKVDIHYPTNAADAPVVVWFHGGGLTGGSKEIPAELTESGLVVIAVNYRLMPAATIAQVVDDAAEAVAWTFANAEKFNGSRRKIFVSGHSAGGFLTDMIGLDKRWMAKYNIDADSIAGLMPLSAQCITHFAVRAQQGLGQLQPTIGEWAPLSYVRADCPPMVIVSGDREMEMAGRYEEQAYFWRMMKLSGHPDVSIYEMQGYDHGQMHHPAFHIVKEQIKRITSANR